MPHSDVELWEGVPFPELVLERLSLYKQGKAAGKIKDADAFPSSKGRAEPWREKEVQSGSAGPSVTAKGGEALWRCRELLHILTSSACRQCGHQHWNCRALSTELCTRNMLSPVSLALLCSKALPTNTWEASGTANLSGTAKPASAIWPVCQPSALCHGSHPGTDPALGLGVSSGRTAGGNCPFLMP